MTTPPNRRPPASKPTPASKRPPASNHPPPPKRLYLPPLDLRRMANERMRAPRSPPSPPPPPQPLPPPFNPERLEYDVLSCFMMKCDVQTVMRSRSASKNFNTVLTGTDFTKLYRSQSQSKGLLYGESGLICPTDPSSSLRNSILYWAESGNHPATMVRLVEFNNFIKLKNLIVMPVWSINGLVLFEAVHESGYEDETIRFLLNPIFREMLILPKLLPYKRDANFKRSIGFGAVGDHYKVVVMTCPKAAQVLEVGSGGGWWSVVNVPNIIPTHRAGTTVRGYIHWIASISGGGDKIVRFDIEKQIFSPLPTTPAYIPEKAFPAGYAPPQLGVLDDKLCITYSGQDQITVWVMQSYGDGSSWIQYLKHKYFIPLRGTPSPSLRLLMKLQNNQLLMEGNENSVVQVDRISFRVAVRRNNFFAALCYEPTLLCMSSLFQFVDQEEGRIVVIPRRAVQMIS